MKKFLKRWLFPHEDAIKDQRDAIIDELKISKIEVEAHAQHVRSTLWKVQDDLTRAELLNGHQARIIELQTRQIDVLNSLVAFYEHVGAKPQTDK